MGWTNPSDVTGAWIGEGSPTDQQLIQTWIDKAEREIRYRVPDIQARIDAEETESPARNDLVQTAIDVVVAMVIRVFRNPQGIRQANTTTGPYTDSVTYGGNVPGGLALTEEELAKLVERRQGAFTISLIPSTSPFSPEYAGGAFPI